MSGVELSLCIDYLRERKQSSVTAKLLLSVLAVRELKYF